MPVHAGSLDKSRCATVREYFELRIKVAPGDPGYTCYAAASDCGECPAKSVQSPARSVLTDTRLAACKVGLKWLYDNGYQSWTKHGFDTLTVPIVAQLKPETPKSATTCKDCARFVGKDKRCIQNDCEKGSGYFEANDLYAKCRLFVDKSKECCLTCGNFNGPSILCAGSVSQSNGNLDVTCTRGYVTQLRLYRDTDEPKTVSVNGPVDNPFKVGDHVKCVASGWGTSPDDVGKVLIVKSLDGSTGIKTEPPCANERRCGAFSNVKGFQKVDAKNVDTKLKMWSNPSVTQDDFKERFMSDQPADVEDIPSLDIAGLLADDDYPMLDQGD